MSIILWHVSIIFCHVSFILCHMISLQRILHLHLPMKYMKRLIPNRYYHIVLFWQTDCSYFQGFTPFPLKEVYSLYRLSPHSQWCLNFGRDPTLSVPLFLKFLACSEGDIRYLHNISKVKFIKKKTRLPLWSPISDKPSPVSDCYTNRKVTIQQPFALPDDSHLNSPGL